MNFFRTLTLGCVMSFFALSSQAQLISVSGQLGYAGPQGDAFKDPVTGEKQTSFGIGYDGDILYMIESMDNKLSVGLMYFGSALFGSESATGIDIGIYGLSLYGVKGQYRMLDPDRKVSPYGSLGLGLSQFSTPDVTVGGSTVEGESAYSLGLRPEIGLDLGGFLLSAAYMVPMKYTVDSSTGSFDGTAGALSISIGYRYTIDLGNFF